MINTKILLAILAAVTVLAGVATRWESRRNSEGQRQIQFEAAKQRYAQTEGYGLGDVSKTIRRMPQ
jgi:hypothetical protein